MRLLDINDAAECLGTTERHMRALIAEPQDRLTSKSAA